MNRHRPDDIVCFEIGSDSPRPWIGLQSDLRSDWNALQRHARRGAIEIENDGDKIAIRGTSRVGLIVLPSGRRLIIRSKLSGLRLLEWMAYLGDFPRLTSWLADAGVTIGSDWPECIGKLFLYSLEHLTRRHLRKEYVPVKSHQAPVRGRIRTSVLGQQWHRLPKIPQIQRRRTFDTPSNVVLALALDRLPVILGDSKDAMRRVSKLREQWALVERKDRDPMAMIIAAQHSCPPGYRESLQLARLILVGAALDSEMSTGGQAFTLPLARVWERAVCRLFDDLSSESGWRRVGDQQRTRRWDDPTGRDDPKRWMTADVVVECKGRRWVLDAKYKRDFGNEGRVDRFQVCAYAVAFDSSHATLIYPVGDESVSVRNLLKAEINGRVVRIDSIGLPMFAGPEHCRSVLASAISQTCAESN